MPGFAPRYNVCHIHTINFVFAFFMHAYAYVCIDIPSGGGELNDAEPIAPRPPPSCEKAVNACELCPYYLYSTPGMISTQSNFSTTTYGAHQRSEYSSGCPISGRRVARHSSHRWYH